MRQLQGRALVVSRRRTGLSRSVSVLAVAAATLVLAPEFQKSENHSDGEGLELSWFGTSAHAKRRRQGVHGYGGVTTYGAFSSGVSSSAGIAAGVAAGVSSGSGSKSGSSSGSSGSSSERSGGSDSGNARSDNNSSRSSSSGSSGNSSSSGTSSSSSSSNSSSKRSDDQGSSSTAANPPATVADTLKSLFEKSETATSAAAASPGSAAASDKSSLGAPTSDTSTAKTTNKNQRPLPPAVLNSTFDVSHTHHASNEILGVRLNGKVVEALQNMGFGVPPQPKMAFEVMLLQTPRGVDADRAQAILREAMPKEKFETNKYYRGYRARSSTGNAHSVTDASPRLTCTGSRCVPRELIKWSTESVGHCSAGIAVGVLDTGIDANHPAFTRPITSSFIPEGRTPAPNWHGTAVFALLAGNARSGTPGLLPNATVYHGNVFYADAQGEFATDTHTVLRALDWMDRAGVKVVNMSFAGPRDQLMEEAIAKLSAKGMMFVAAVGNEGPTAEPAYPAAYRQVIAVTAIKADRRIYPFANRGRHIDLSAPGVDIWTAVPGGREGFYTGTSFAAPFATALVATLYGESKTHLKEKLLERLEYDDLGLPGRDSTYGRGLALSPKTCAPAPLVAETPPPPPSWGTTSIERASTRPATPPTVSAGFR